MPTKKQPARKNAPATRKKATTKKASASKSPLKKAPTNKSPQPKATPAPTATPATITEASPAAGPFRDLRAIRLPGKPKSGYGGFSREGCFALDEGRALWANPHVSRVGWVSFADGSFQELFPCDSHARSVGTDGQLAIGVSRDQFVVVDPAKGKKPVRFPGAAETCSQIVVTPTHVLTMQSHKSKREELHVWNRSTFKLEKVTGNANVRLTGSEAWGAHICAAGRAAFFVAASNSVEVWSAPWARPVVIALPKTSSVDPMGRGGPRALGLSSDGRTLVVAYFDELVVADADSGESKRIPAPSPLGTVENEAVRGHVYAKTWVHPLPHDQLLLLDGTLWGSTYDEKSDTSWDRYEVVVALWDTSAGRCLAKTSVVMRSDTDYGLATQISISDRQVLLNRERLVELV